MRRLGLISFFIFFSCSLWEYDDPSDPYEKEVPETYLSLIASDTIYAHLDSSSGEYTYVIDEEPNPGMVWDTLEHAFTTITTSKQQLHWWGEDKDGYIIGYKYKWSSDSIWTFTAEEEGLFYVPIQTDLDVFSFEVIAIDNDSLEDLTPAKLTLPIKNSAPMISFRYRSNPFVDDIQGDTSLTFPTRTFVWDVTDQDGIETVIDIYYALDDTCDTCWTRLDAASYSSITLTDIEPGYHRFYIQAIDIAGAESNIAFFPDDTNPNEPGFWRVMPVHGNVLLVDDFPLDIDNDALSWYRSSLDSIIGQENYSIWEIGNELPYSSSDVSANLNYFQSVVWFSAYLGFEAYHDAENSIYSYVMNGGNIFLNITEIRDTTFSFFPLDSIFYLNPDGRMLSGKLIESTISSNFDLITSTLISIFVRGFVPSFSEFENITPLYNLSEPEDGDLWEGTPNICSIGQFSTGPNSLSGKVVFMSLPLHNGTIPVMEPNGSLEGFIDYILNTEFTE